MGSFVISYVPEVEHITEIDVLHRLDNIGDIDEIKKLPRQHFSWRTLNYQYGGSLHIEAVHGMYQAVYIPEHDCDFKGVNLCFTGYNIEDTYDVMVGARYIIRNSHVKEMSEYRELILNEAVTANTPITIQFHNKSGTEKYMLYDVITQLDEDIVSTDNLEWVFDWIGTDMILHDQDLLTLVINSPNYVNLQSKIDSFVLTITNKTNIQDTWTISISESNIISSSYVELDPEYQNKGYLGRVNLTAITSVHKYDKTIHIVFKNIGSNGSVNPHMIEMSIEGSVINSINGGI